MLLEADLPSLTIRISGLCLPTSNEMRRKYRCPKAYRSLRKKIGLAFGLALLDARRCGLWDGKVIEECCILVERHQDGNRAPDWDGLYGGVKPLLDVMQPPSKSMRNGQGLIRNDNPRHLRYLAVHPILKSDTGVVVKIYLPDRYEQFQDEIIKQIWRR